MPEEFTQLYELLADFWLRDYRQDVRQLNLELKTSKSLSAGLEEAPPSVLTGDPFSLVPGECIVVLGKNPKWRAGGLAGAWADEDVKPSIESHAKRDFAAYQRQRASYFHGNDPQHHGVHFTTLGKRLGPHFFGGTARSASEFMRTRVAVLDVLPWWSKDTSDIDPARLALSLEPLDAWRSLISGFVRTLRPSLIVVHGLGFRTGVEAILGTRLNEFVWGRTSAGRRVRGLAGATPCGAPIVGHALVTEGRVWPAGRWSYDDLLTAAAVARRSSPTG